MSKYKDIVTVISPIIVGILLISAAGAEQDGAAGNPPSEIVTTTEVITASVPIPANLAYEYYASYDYKLLPGNNWVNALRIVAQQNATTYYIDTNNDGLAEYNGTLPAGGMFEKDVPTGTHVLSDKPLTIVQYDDYYFDWEDAFLPPTSAWGEDYWYAGIKGYGLGQDHLLITAGTNGTVVNIDINNDGVIDQSYSLNKSQVANYSVSAIYDVGYVWKDPRAGAHITSNYPIQVQAFASMDAYFGSAYNLLPTEALGTNHYVPFIRTLNPMGWDVSDKILIVATENVTNVTIDEDNDGVPENVSTLNRGGTMEYPSADKTTPFLNGTHVTSNKPIAVVYSSPRGMQHWDGGATQIVPESSALKDYWNTVSWNTIQWIVPPYNLSNSPYGWGGEADLLIFVYQNGTTVNIDKNNDGIPEKTYTADAGNKTTYKVGTYGEHIYADKPILVLQTWYTDASAEIEMLGYSAKLEVPVDIKPQSCPNPLNTNDMGMLPAAILGTSTLDVSTIDPSTVMLEGVSAMRWSMEDVATPFEPFIGKVDKLDCTTSGMDGFMDLTLKFDAQDVVAALGTVSDGDVITLELTGNLYDGTPIMGEDVVWIKMKK